MRSDAGRPRFAELEEALGELYPAARAATGGEVSRQIPRLALVDPELFGVAACGLDGRRFALGDARVPFCVQSCWKPVGYALALEEHGAAAVHRHVGWEPSGHGFNAITLDDRGLPFNPMINAGALVCCSLLRAELGSAERFEHASAGWSRLCGGERPGFDNAVFLSEREHSDRNRAIAHFLREHGAFPRGTDLAATLELYFQCCSIQSTAEQLSVVAATLARGGVCPQGGERVLRADTVRHVLSLMSSCGMYDFSGEWAFAVGLPAKSGIAGAILVVVPGLGGLASYAPRLDEHGNSVRGIALFRALVERLRLHAYDRL